MEKRMIWRLALSPGFVLFLALAVAGCGGGGSSDSADGGDTGGTAACAQPKFSLPSGTYSGPRTVEFDTATTGATIRYTTDGTDPYASSNVMERGSLGEITITVNTTVTIKAIASKPGWADSPIASVTYTIIMRSRTFGGAGTDSGGSVQQTSDGGYVFVGYTGSYEIPDFDVSLIKTDASGNEEWSKTFGGASYDMGYSVRQTADGGYILTGATESYGAGGTDVYLIKTDASGNEEWSKTFGGAGYDTGSEVLQTTDGGYIVVGSSYSYGDPYGDVFLIKTDASGNEEWMKTYGEENTSEAGYDILQTPDGGYVILGVSYIFGDSDIYLVKTDASGNVEWTQTYGGDGNQSCGSLLRDDDGGFVLAGNSSTYDESGEEKKVGLLIRTDALGNMVWERTFRGFGLGYATGVLQASDGGYVIAGYSICHDDYNDWDTSDVVLIKTDISGNPVWTKTIGGVRTDVASSILRNAEGDYVMVGYTNSYGAGEEDVLLLFTDTEGNAL